MGIWQALALVVVVGSAGAAALAWRTARDARRAAGEGAEHLKTLQAAVRRACHDLNNPLAAAAINAELLGYVCPDDERARQQAQKIQDQIQLAKDAVAALHQLARSSDANLEL
jgi:signal transduction histidine kinase